MNENSIIITPGQLRILLKGLCSWNCPALELLSNSGRKSLSEAQDLIEKLWELRGAYSSGVGEWLKISDTSPPKCTSVIATDGRAVFEAVRFNNGNWYRSTLPDMDNPVPVIFWQLMPTRPDIQK